jgi:hypothetical protein
MLCRLGHLYGLEKIWALKHYRKEGLPALPFAEPVLELLKSYTCVEDFRTSQVLAGTHSCVGSMAHGVCLE